MMASSSLRAPSLRENHRCCASTCLWFHSAGCSTDGSTASGLPSGASITPCSSRPSATSFCFTSSRSRLKTFDFHFFGWYASKSAAVNPGNMGRGVCARRRGRVKRGDVELQAVVKGRTRDPIRAAQRARRLVEHVRGEPGFGELADERSRRGGEDEAAAIGLGGGERVAAEEQIFVVAVAELERQHERRQRAGAEACVARGEDEVAERGELERSAEAGA